MLPSILRLIFTSSFFLLVTGSPSSKGGHCPPFNNGSFTVHEYQLYPENGAWDSRNCIVYFRWVAAPDIIACLVSSVASALFNGSLIAFDPYKNETVEVITFPGITEGIDEHGSGIHWDERTGLITAVIDAQPAFLTDAANVTGDYWLIKYDPSVGQEVWRVNLTETTQALWGGFQDVTVDEANGNSFVIGTYPKSIIRVDSTGTKVDIWYPPQTTNTSVHGYTGIASFGNTLLVIDDNGVPEESFEGNSSIYRFDMSAEKGEPILVQHYPNKHINVSDALHLPSKYDNTVMLVSIDYTGVQVLRSKDAWETAEFLGTITSDFPVFFESIIPATFEIGESLFMIGEYFPGQRVPGTKAGNRTDFPMFDITDQVAALLV